VGDTLGPFKEQGVELWALSVQGTEVSVGDTLGPDESNVAEALNVAWAGHEITADWTLDTLDFFDAVQPTNEVS
jgi:hypothetical protein